MRFPFVIAHDDWDGIASALLLTGGEATIEALDYFELARAVDATPEPRLFVEVHDPALLGPHDVVVDHHVPRLGFVPPPYPRCYVATRERLLALSRTVDLSNVAGIASLLRRPEYVSEEGRQLLRRAVEPPEDVVHLSNVVDNPNLVEDRRELELVVGHAYARCRGEVLSIALRHGVDDLRGALEEMRALGSGLMREVERVASGLRERSRGAVAVIARRRESAWLAFAAILVIQLEEGGRGRYVFGFELGDGRIRATFVSGDSWAIEAAESLGGGGRPGARGTYVGGATAEERRVLELLRSAGIEPLFVE